VGFKFAGNTELTKGDSMVDIEGFAVLTWGLGTLLANTVALPCRGALSAPRLPVVALVAAAPSRMGLSRRVVVVDASGPRPITGRVAEVVNGRATVGPVLSCDRPAAIVAPRASLPALLGSLRPSESCPTFARARQRVTDALSHEWLAADGAIAVESPACRAHEASGAAAILGVALDAPSRELSPRHAPILAHVVSSRKEMFQ